MKRNFLKLLEPHDMPWLEKIDVVLLREKVDMVDKSLFRELQENDILFIDSSHIIRPQGDVLFEYQEKLPILNKEFLIHTHDIFHHQDYSEKWVYEHKLRNEQYLPEAFLTFNKEFRIIGALNYLANHHKNELRNTCPVLSQQPGKYSNGAFWMIKN